LFPVELQEKGDSSRRGCCMAAIGSHNARNMKTLINNLFKIKR